MHPKRRSKLIDGLRLNVEHVGHDFEQFAGILMSARLGILITHAGVNLRGYPVAAVVDSESDDGQQMVEYSDRRGYFTGAMTKAERDLKKVLKDRPNAAHIYLVTGERTRQQKAADFKVRIQALPEMQGKSLTILGSEELAAEIVDNHLLNEQVVGRLSQYLPDLQSIADIEAAAALVPTLPSGILARPDVDAEIVAHLAVTPVLTVSGMGGLGKSIAAIAYADLRRDDYQVRIWLDGEDVKRAESLRAFPLVRVNDPRNIAGLLESGGCLLIIDDASQDISVDVLRSYCGDGSHVILTRRIAPPGAFEPPLMTEDEARVMLDVPEAPCPSDVFDAIWNTVNGYPLSLNLLRATAQSGVSWDELADDCRAVGKFMDDDGVLLVDRLLGRLQKQLKPELSVFLWAKLPAIDSAFLTEEVGHVGVRNLRSYGLTSVDRGAVVRLHDVVFAALRSLDWCDDVRVALLDGALQAFIVRVADEPGLRLWNVVRSMMPKLEAMVASGADQGPCLYGLLSVWEPDEVRPDLVGDPIASAAQLAGESRGPLAVITLIEAVEQLFLLDKHAGGRVASERLAARMPIFETLAALPELTLREEAQILHHEGKALKRLGKTDEAAERFEAVLAGAYPMDEARLQLVSIYRSKPEKAQEVIALVDTVFARWAAGEDVTYSVILGLIERLPAGEGRWRNDIITRHAKAIESTIVEGANQGVGQAARALAPLGRFISTEMPELFTSIFTQVPQPMLETLGSDGDRFAWAEIYAEGARIPGSDSAPLRQRAFRFYDAIVKPDPFYTQRQAEVLIDMGRAADAEEMLSTIIGARASEWIERLFARTRLALGDPDKALVRINKALDLLKAEHFRSEFLELRYDIRLALDDPDALEDLQAAIDASQKTGERRRLDQRLNALAGS